MVVAPVSYDTVRTNRVRVDAARFTELETLFTAMASECSARMPASIDPAHLSFERAADMRYVGQGYNVSIPLPDAPLSDASPEDVRGWFDETYRKLYGRTYDDLELEFINLRLTATAPMGEVRLAPAAARLWPIRLHSATRIARLPDASSRTPYTNALIWVPGSPVTGRLLCRRMNRPPSSGVMVG